MRQWNTRVIAGQDTTADFVNKLRHTHLLFGQPVTLHCGPWPLLAEQEFPDVVTASASPTALQNVSFPLTNHIAAVQ